MSTSAATPLQSGSIDSMIVMDRAVDLVTPLCTQLTYEGLVDEVVGIKNCQCLFSVSLPQSDNALQPTWKSTQHSSTLRLPPRVHLPPSQRSVLFSQRRRSSSSPRPTLSSLN